MFIKTNIYIYIYLYIYIYIYIFIYNVREQSFIIMILFSVEYILS